MSPVRYHPLIDADSSGMEKVPVFPSRRLEIVKEHHNMWLEPITLSTYRVMSKNPIAEKKSKKLIVRCPICGRKMESICAPLDQHILSMVRCMHCSKENGGRNNE